MGDSEKYTAMVMDDWEDDRSESNSESEDSDEEIAAWKKMHQKEKPQATYNKKALLEALNNIKVKWGKNGDLPVPWEETFDVSIPLKKNVGVDDNEIDYNDELQRELLFYQQALQAYVKARDMLNEKNIAHEKPDGFFGPMVKSDAHLKKIKDSLLKKKSRIEESFKKQRIRDQKKIAKETKVEKQHEKAAKKREGLEKVKLWKKGKRSMKYLQENDDFLGDLKQGRKRKADGMSRKVRNEKYGFGGKKRFKKSNDSKSHADTSAFDAAANRRTSFASGKGKKAKPQRPGKARRTQMRNRRK